MLTPEAINRINELFAAGAQLPDTHAPTVALPGDTKIVSLEKYLQNPLRMRAAYTTPDVESFIQYLKGNTVTATGVFFDLEDMEAVAVIDLGDHTDPGWGDHRATYAAKFSPEYAAIRALASRPVPQRELIEFIEEWADQLTILGTSDAEMDIKKGLQAVRKVDIKRARESSHEDTDMSASLSEFERIEATSGAGDLPRKLVFRCSVVDDSMDRDIVLPLHLITTSDRPHFGARIWRKDAILRETAYELLERIRDGSGVDRVFVGSVRK